MARWTEADLARLQHAKAGTSGQAIVKRAKYRNRPIVIGGVRFDSRLESRCDRELRFRHQAGEVLWYTRQVPFALEGGVVYRADFLAALTSGGIEILDATGLMTQVKANKLKQMKARYGIDVIVWTDKAA